MTTTNRTSHPIALRDATVTDPFWASRQELVRTQVIPYQWNALNDNVPGAAPSYCMHNFTSFFKKTDSSIASFMVLPGCEDIRYGTRYCFLLTLLVSS